MAKKTIGYVRLEWTCPRCGARNPGPKKSCSGCGAPQPQDVAFHQAAQEDLIQEEDEIARAKKGPDIHCPYCGARNPADAKTCSQCSGDLTEGQARETGAVVGAHRDQPAPEIACPSCGAMNPATTLHCSKCGAPLGEKQQPVPVTKQPATSGCSPVLYAVGAVGIAIIALIIFLLVRTKDVVGTVEAASWTRSIAIEAFGPADYEGWLDEIPNDAEVGDCAEKVHHVQDSPAPGSREICGTPYTKDTGSGYGEVVQDCEYEVTADWCQYTVQEWRVVDTMKQSGQGMTPEWPVLQLQSVQREGQRQENFEVQFDADGNRYTYSTSRLEDYQRFQPGTRWILKVNQLGGVNSVEPAR